MGSSSPQPVKTESTTNTDPWGPQQPYLKQVFSEAQRLYNDPSRPQFYPGQTFADPSQSTLQGLAGTEARAQQGSPTLAAAQNEATKSLSGEYLNAGNPHFDQMAGRIRAQVAPAISSGFANAGGTGGLQARASSMGLGDAIGSLAYQNYGDERNRMGQYAAMAPQLAAADYLDPTMLTQAGAQREQIAQQPISEAIGRWQFDQNAPQAKLADYQQMTSGNFGGTSNTIGTQFMPQQNPWMQALGFGLNALGTGANLASKLPFSDERLKKDIKRVGETDEGLPIYTYKYKWGGPPMMGVMAQDVAEVKPEAVQVQPLNGVPYLAVDYAQVS